MFLKKILNDTYMNLFYYVDLQLQRSPVSCRMNAIATSETSFLFDFINITPWPIVKMSACPTLPSANAAVCIITCLVSQMRILLNCIQFS